MANHPNRKKYVYRQADYENGCEICWDQLAADCKESGLPSPRTSGEIFKVPRKWTNRPCTHGAPEFAQGILLPPSQ